MMDKHNLVMFPGAKRKGLVKEAVRKGWKRAAT